MQRVTTAGESLFSLRATRDRFLDRASEQSFLHGEERLDELLRCRRPRRMKCQAACPDADIKLRAFDRKAAVRTIRRIVEFNVVHFEFFELIDQVRNVDSLAEFKSDVIKGPLENFVESVMLDDFRRDVRQATRNDGHGRIFGILGALHPKLEVRRHNVAAIDNQILSLVIHVGTNPPVDLFDLLLDLLLRNALNKGLRRAVVSIWNPVPAFYKTAERPNLHRVVQLEKHLFHLVVPRLDRRSFFQKVIQIGDYEILALAAIYPRRLNFRLAEDFPQGSGHFRCEIVLKGERCYIPALFESGTSVSFECFYDLKRPEPCFRASLEYEDSEVLHDAKQVRYSAD